MSEVMNVGVMNVGQSSEQVFAPFGGEIEFEFGDDDDDKDDDVTCSITKTHWDRSGGMFWRGNKITT